LEEFFREEAGERVLPRLADSLVLLLGSVVFYVYLGLNVGFVVAILGNVLLSGLGDGLGLSRFSLRLESGIALLALLPLARGLSIFAKDTLLALKNTPPENAIC